MQSYALRKFQSSSAYHELMLALPSIAHSCSFVVRDELVIDQEGIGFIERIGPWLMATARVSEWPGTKLLGQLADLYTYRLDTNLSSELLHAATRFGDWRAPSLPEDPAFYRADGTMIMASIVHEKDVYFELTADEHRAITASAPNAGLVAERSA